MGTQKMKTHSQSGSSSVPMILAVTGVCLMLGILAHEPALPERLALAYPAPMIEFFVFLAVAALAWYFLGTRWRRLQQVLTRLERGDLAARTGFRGLSPLATLGRQLDRVLDQLQTERHNLQASEARLRLAVQGCDIAIWDWALEQGIVYYSPRWKSLLGYAEDDIALGGAPWLQWVHPDDLPRLTRELEDSLAGDGEQFVSEHRLRRQQGDYLWVRQSGVIGRDEHGRALRMIGALADITPQHEAEQALLSSREAYRSVLEGVTQVIFRADDEGRLLFLNPAWTELTGHAVATTQGTFLFDYVAADERTSLRDFLRQARAGGDTRLTRELRLRCADGAWRWFMLALRGAHLDGVSLLAGVLADIEPQKSSEAALLHSNRVRDAILQLGPDGFVFADEAGIVSFVNPAFVEMTGLSDRDCVGLPLEHLDARLGELAETAPGFARAGDSGDGLLQLRPPHKVVIRWLLRGLPDDGGGVRGRVLYLRDITRESEVDQMKSDFLSTAAHELRTPMSSIFGFSEMLLSREFEPAMQRDLLERIHRQTRNLINLVNELLDLSRIEARGGKSFKMAVQDPTPVVLNAVASQYVPAATHKLEFDWPKKLGKIRVDGEKFQQCVINLLSNAVKYSPDGGTIRLSAASRGEGATEMLGVRVADQGIGMTPEQVRRIFERFYRADSSGKIPGTGLGMSLVNEYMKIFGGDVEVISEPGQGTTVTLWLPVVREHSAIEEGQE